MWDFVETLGHVRPNIPKHVDAEYSKFDEGFLEKMLPKLQDDRIIKDMEEINGIYRRFTTEHYSILVYSAFNNSWRIQNFSFENINFLEQETRMHGQVYSVTNYQHLKEGGIRSFGDVEKKHKPIIVLQMYKDNLKGLVLHKKVNKENYHTELIIGDKHGEKDCPVMPRFRDGKIHDFLDDLVGSPTMRKKIEELRNSEDA